MNIVIGWYLDKTDSSCWLLYSLISTAFIGPFTAMAIGPTNSLLMDGDSPGKKGDAWIRDQMTKWDRLHLVRTLAFMASVGFMSAYWAIK